MAVGGLGENPKLNLGADVDGALLVDDVNAADAATAAFCGSPPKGEGLGTEGAFGAANENGDGEDVPIVDEGADGFVVCGAGALAPNPPNLVRRLDPVDVLIGSAALTDSFDATVKEEDGFPNEKIGVDVDVCEFAVGPAPLIVKPFEILPLDVAAASAGDLEKKLGTEVGAEAASFSELLLLSPKKLGADDSCGAIEGVWLEAEVVG